MFKLFDTKIKDDTDISTISKGDIINVTLTSGYTNLAQVTGSSEDEKGGYFSVLFPENLNWGEERPVPGTHKIYFNEIKEFSFAGETDFTTARKEYMNKYNAEHREHLNELKRESAERKQEFETMEESDERRAEKAEYDKEHQAYANMKRNLRKQENAGMDTSRYKEAVAKKAREEGVQPRTL